MKNKIFLFLALVAVTPSFVPIVVAGEIDVVTVVNWVVDGDTFDTTSEDRVRLAEIG